MEISHFLSIIDSLCIVNVLYSDGSDVTLLRQNKLPLTVHRRTEVELLEFVFHSYLQSPSLYSDGHSKHICTVFILLMDAKQSTTLGGINENTFNYTYKRIHRSMDYIEQFSTMRALFPRRNYLAVILDLDSFLSIGFKASLLCVEDCAFQNNLVFLIKDDQYFTIVSTMCTMPKRFLFNKYFSIGKEDLDLPSRMRCRRIENRVNTLDDLFTERIYEWKIDPILLHLSDSHLLSNPAKILQRFNLKVLLRRLTRREYTLTLHSKFPWDGDLLSWYIILHLLALSNSTGTTIADIYRFEICNGPLMKVYRSSEFLVTGTTKLEAITCYTQPLLSFHIYSSPFLFNLWISISLVVVFLSVFLNTYIYFFHRKCSSSISSTLFSVSLLANVSYYVPKSVWDSNVFICACTPWILTTMILSNCYQRLVISEVNAPMKGEELQIFSKYTICDNKTGLLKVPPAENMSAAARIVRKLEDTKAF